MLYKLGLTYKRQEYHKKEVTQLIEERIEQQKLSSKASIREMSEFIGTFHRDFLDYGAKQHKERQDLVRHNIYEKSYYRKTRCELCMII